MIRLYSSRKRFPGHFTGTQDITFPSQPVPLKEGKVTEVIPTEGESYAMSAHYAETYDSLGNLLASAAGIMHDVPRVPLRFKLATTGEKTFVAQIPRDAQYMLKPGELVIVYSHMLAEHIPTVVAEVDLSYPKKTDFPLGLSRLSKLAALSGLSIIAALQSGSEEDIPCENVIPPKRIDDFKIKNFIDEIPKKPEFLRDHVDPIRDLKARPVSLESLESLMESRMPVFVQGMQVLDDNGEVRFQAVCEQGMEFR